MGEPDAPATKHEQAAASDPAEEHRQEVQSLEEAVHHETTQHAPKHHLQRSQAVPPTARSQQRRFPR